MEFEKREGYSIERDSLFYQISQDEFVNCSYSSPEVITWIKGKKRTEKEADMYAQFGVVGNSFFFHKDRTVIKKAELQNDEIIITESVQIKEGVRAVFERFYLHYFVERDENPNVSYAIPINEDYRLVNGIKFNVSIDELKTYYLIHVQDNFLYGIIHYGINSSIRRYQSDSDEYLEKGGLPYISQRSVIFNNWRFSLSDEGDLISLNLNDFSYEFTKTNLQKFSGILGIDENGMVTVQSLWEEGSPVHLFTAKLPEKYINRDNKKRSEELEKKKQTEKNTLFVIALFLSFLSIIIYRYYYY